MNEIAYPVIKVLLAIFIHNSNRINYKIKKLSHSLSEILLGKTTNYWRISDNDWEVQWIKEYSLPIA